MLNEFDGDPISDDPKKPKPTSTPEKELTTDPDDFPTEVPQDDNFEEDED